jgi:hypothetical protein
MSANRLSFGDWHIVISKLSAEVIRLIGNGGRDVVVREVPISAGLGGGRWRESAMSHLGTRLTLAVLPHCWDERTFAPTTATTQVDLFGTLGPLAQGSPPCIILVTTGRMGAFR